MPPRDFIRPSEGFRFRFGGMKLNARPDALPQGKYALAINVREYEEGTIRCRPGLGPVLFVAGAALTHVTDIRGYASLNTDNLPRIVSHVSDDTIWVDTVGQVGSLAGGGHSGATLIPFRPGASPNPFMYVANGADYQKFSAPSISNVVTSQRVGIAEPQIPPDADTNAYLNPPNPSGPGYTNAGTAGASSNSTRVSDVVGAAVFQTASVGFVLQVSSTVAYQKLMTLNINGQPFLIEDVFPPLTVNLTILSIFYFSGTTGRCVLVLNTLTGPESAAESSIYAPVLFASLRRNSIIKVGTEAVRVLSVTPGPDGTVAVETSTTAAHTTADKVTIVPAIQVAPNGFNVAPGNTIADSVPPKSYAVTTGVGTQATGTGLVNPFVNTVSGLIASQDDLISFGFKVDTLANLTEMKILFDISDGTFTKDFFYFTVRASDIAAALTNAITQLGIAQTVAQKALADEENAIATGNQLATVTGAQSAPGNNAWTQIAFSIGELTRVGNDQTKSLMTFTAFQVLWNVSGTLNVVQDGFFSTFGGSWPDVGDVGAPYRYRVRPRASTTGVIGNPSPASRYGVNPRRQAVQLALPSAAYDPQIDTWDIERYGGSVTSWRFVGSTPSSNSTFLDNFSDDTALEGDELEFDNFEPWPSVDVPFSATATSVVGTTALVTIPSPTNALRFLPGNLVQIGAVNVYTIRTRPTLVSGTTYLFQFEENAGTQTNVRVVIQEPEIARQFLPYMWGPDAYGTVFACGDPLRPGTLYFCKPYAPDSAPGSYNQEIVQGSEPLLGGEIVDGVSYAASTERWWRLYFQPENPEQRYSAVQEPFTRGLAAPFGHCNDGKNIYYWARDGIYRNDQSLTDEDLYNLFPHEGVNGQDITYNGVVIPSPDYSQVMSFRLTYSNGFLYAIYRTANPTYANPVWITLNLRTGAWGFEFSTLTTGHVSCAYHVEQQKESSGALNPVLLFGAQSSIYKQTDLSNDGSGAGAPIFCTLAVREFDGGDIRAPKQWGDYFLDLVPAAVAGVPVTPMSLGVGVVAPTTIPTGAVRSRLPVSVAGAGPIVSDFLGLFLTWMDDFSQQTVPTQLFAWQPSFDIQPARSLGWQTFGSSFGLQGYGHIRQIAFAWVSTAQVTITITTIDGQAPQQIVLPSSGGVYTKRMFPVSANKGQIFIFKATSTAPFQIFEDDCEVHLGQWGRSGPYTIAKSFGGMQSAESPV